eukprot:5202779-Karenia_brevis.AAC.1
MVKDKKKRRHEEDFSKGRRKEKSNSRTRRRSASASSSSSSESSSRRQRSREQGARGSADRAVSNFSEATAGTLESASQFISAGTLETKLDTMQSRMDAQLQEVTNRICCTIQASNTALFQQVESLVDSKVAPVQRGIDHVATEQLALQQQ